VIKSNKSRHIGAEWRKWRLQHMMSQDSLARILGCWRETVTKIEGGASPGYRLQVKMRALMKQHEREKQNAESHRARD